jgi:hypothetical protein
MISKNKLGGHPDNMLIFFVANFIQNFDFGLSLHQKRLPRFYYFDRNFVFGDLVIRTHYLPKRSLCVLMVQLMLMRFRSSKTQKSTHLSHSVFQNIPIVKYFVALQNIVEVLIVVAIVVYSCSSGVLLISQPLCFCLIVYLIDDKS